LDLGNVAILPGLVNAHTHLDLSGLRGQAQPSQDFLQWLRAVIHHRRSLSPEQASKDIQAGIAECVQHGTTLIGDISSQGFSWSLLTESPVRAVVFYEMLGLPRERATTAEKEAQAWLESHSATSACRPGLSPHAPYSVRASLFQAAFEMARNYRLPLATHLAETREELELLEHHRGPFVDFLSELGVWDPEGLVRNHEDIIHQSSQVPNFLIIHGNYLSAMSDGVMGRKADGLQSVGLALTTHDSPTMVYCPRTHAAFGHDSHPFQDILASGGRVALGTDSLASNPDLDVLAEARFLHGRYPNVPAKTVLRMITLSGAEALGWDEETGSLAPGKSADLVVLPLATPNASDPHSLVFESSTAVTRVMCRGNWIHQTAS
jgi:cytosine/adenosine deaminase-related metal-dependent hydrolase